jgi:hypothetical protein
MHKKVFDFELKVFIFILTYTGYFKFQGGLNKNIRSARVKFEIQP